MSPLRPGQSVDRYTVEKVLGEGGIAVVYRVRHDTLRTHHALKVLTNVTGASRSRLLREGRAQAGLHHPNVVAVTDVLTVEERPALLMEFIDGPTLDALAEAHPLTIAEALAVFRGIVSAVAHIHARGLVHRDLKPLNVMLTLGPDGDVIPKVTDFGIAKTAPEEPRPATTRPGATLGTPQYMAPEQIRDAGSVDKRADIYSLGCVLYTLVCGEPPYEHQNLVDLFEAVTHGAHRDPRELRADLPEGVVRAIKGALQVRPEDRIPDCAALLAILDDDPARAAAADARALARGTPLAFAVGRLVENARGHTPIPAPRPNFTENAPRPTSCDDIVGAPVAVTFDDQRPSVPPPPPVWSAGEARWAWVNDRVWRGVIVVLAVACVVATVATTALMVHVASSPPVPNVVFVRVPLAVAEPVPTAPPAIVAPALVDATPPTASFATADEVPVKRIAPRRAAAPPPEPVVVAPPPDPGPVAAIVVVPPDLGLGSVRVEGDAARVVLRQPTREVSLDTGRSGRALPLGKRRAYDVPAGTWDAYAAFGDGALVPVGVVTVTDAATTTLRCTARTATCD